MSGETATGRPPGVPGLSGIEHIGLTVPDLDAATGFFSDVLGAEALYDIGPFASPDDWMANHLGGGPQARIHRMRVLKIAHGPVLELFEFAETSAIPTNDPAVPPGGWGASWHIAFYVEDMEAALAALRAHEVAIQSGPVQMTEGPSAGLTWQ